ncbi:MAG: ABC transporter ATP-binding protein, partial [Bacillota bacterium]
MLSLTDVSYTYPAGDDRILRGINLQVAGDGVTAITGPNGSGKTTLGKIMAGIIKPAAGRAEIFGTDTREMSLGQIGQKIGYLFQEPERQIFAPTVEEELSFVLRVRGLPGAEIEDTVSQMLERFHLLGLRDRFPFLLSRGEKQRLALAAVLVNRPRFLVLDEPTTALDLRRQVE